MIVLDSSILVGIIKLESDCEDLLDVVAAEECAIGAPTLVETRAWCLTNLMTRKSRWLEEFVTSRTMSIVPFSREMTDVASVAFETFGRASGHPAKLNFGDCLAYAASAVTRAPLLFKGSDFGLTNVMSHPASIRL
jgi:ribonuclease VapC